jgi:GntR family transcriptional regulator
MRSSRYEERAFVHLFWMHKANGGIMIVIDYQNRKPIYEQIVERFQTLIITGAIEPDSQMPSVRSLAVDLSINPNTIQKAYSVLEQEGFIYPVKGRGNFVSGNSELKVKKQEAFFASLENLVKKGKELDVKSEIFLQKAEEYYKEGSYDRN